MSLYREPFHLKSSLVKPPAVELATSRWYEMVMLIHTIFSPIFLTAVFSRFFSDKFRLVFLGISSSLGKGSSGSGENITSQNRWRDYPTAWWNHQTPWKKWSNHEFVVHHPEEKTREIGFEITSFFRGRLFTRSSVISATRCSTYWK